jgi:hypothetical protein
MNDKETIAELVNVLHVVLMALRADFNTRIQQPAEARANSVLIEVIADAIEKVEGVRP